MRNDDSRGTFEDVVRIGGPGMAEIASRLREVIGELLPDGIEVPRPGEQHVDYGLGPGKSKDVFGYILPAADYIRLGFFYGGGLPDPAGLLVGGGKRMRHVKIRSLDEANRPEVRALIVAAIEERREVLGAA